MKKSVKILSVILMAILLVSFMANNVFADPADIINSVKNEEVAQRTTVTTSLNQPMQVVGKVLVILRNVAVIASIIIIIIMGIKYITGSLQQRADYKKSFMPLIIGMVLAIGATTIASWIFSVTNGLTN